MKSFPAIAVATAMAIGGAAFVFAQSTPPGQSQTKTKPAASADKEKKEAGDEKDEAISLDKVPKVVHDTLAQYAKDAEVKTASKGDVDGTAVFEFDIEQGARKWELSITPKGAFFGSEEV